MKPALTLLALLTLAPACGDAVRVYRGQPPHPSATPVASAAPDPEAWRSKRPEAGKPGELSFPTPELITLPNGLVVYLAPRPAPVVTLWLCVRQGASSVPSGKSGLAALTTRMLTEGTKTKSSLALAEAVEALGSSLDSDTGRDESRVGLSALGGDLDTALGLLAEVVQNPAFAEKDFERVRGEWLDSLLSERQDPSRLASLAGLRLLNGPVHGAPVRGSVPDVKALTIRDLRDFHRRAYTPKTAALLVVGKVDAAQLKSSVERHFGAWKGSAGAAPLPFEPPKPPSKLRLVLIDRPGAVQSAIFAAQPFPKRSEPGYEVREVMGRVVGGLFTSRINLNLREEHAYTYGAFAQPIATQTWGAFFVSTSVRTDVTAPALSEILIELEKAKDPARGAPIKVDEVGRAKADLIHSLGADLEHTSRVAETITNLFVDGLPRDYYTRYPNVLAGIDEKAVSDAARTLTPSALLAVVVGDRSQIESELKAKGFAVELGDEHLVE